jgi:sporulation protein YlmC with PRC-barrel domain
MENINVGSGLTERSNAMPVSALIGSSIINHDGESLGRLHDIMVDMAQGKIQYVLIEFGGFMGLNQKYFALPFEVLTIAKEHRNSFIINETKESIKRFISFDKDHLPTAGFKNTKADASIVE